MLRMRARHRPLLFKISSRAARPRLGDSGGKVADYIPELGKADPAIFGIALATVDGQIYAAGDADLPFTIQSVSKPFMYGHALQHYGRQFVLRHVGVEPTGEAFNSIVLDEVANRPFNPMVNAGAIAVAELMEGGSLEERIDTMLKLFSDLAGRRLKIDESVFRSELATGHRNRAIAYMMLNTGMIERDPDDVLDLYFRQCSITVTCRDLAMMAATLANGGDQPADRDRGDRPALCARRALGDELLRHVQLCRPVVLRGRDAGEERRLRVHPGRHPGQIGIGVYSPPLDAQGNSVRGIKVCQDISNEFELHAFNNRTNVSSVIRRLYRGDRVRSSRLRTARGARPARCRRRQDRRDRGARRAVLRLDRAAAPPHRRAAKPPATSSSTSSACTSPTRRRSS